MSVESNEVKGCFVQSQVTLNLLLFTISFTIFLEIEVDFFFYVRYRSEEISPATNDAASPFPKGLIPAHLWVSRLPCGCFPLELVTGVDSVGWIAPLKQKKGSCFHHLHRILST